MKKEKKNKMASTLTKNEKSCEQKMTAISLSPLYTAAETTRLFSKATIEKFDKIEAMRTIVEQIKEIHDGKMQDVESMLTAQAITLNTIFSEMAKRSAIHMDSSVQVSDTYMRMALKAQGQCRATLETLAEIKNPKTTNFVRQQNNANQQQVNNNTYVNDAHARTEKNINPSNELLSEAKNETLDPRRAAATSKLDSDLETVEVVNRA